MSIALAEWKVIELINAVNNNLKQLLHNAEEYSVTATQIYDTFSHMLDKGEPINKRVTKNVWLIR